ncbi:MAG: hypothetical protein GWN58_03545, partial [Anaerolineae bacterium]|nr:hypothetical protein [Anaerolineae bacterium]
MSLRTAMNTYYDVDDPGAAPGSSPTAPTLAEQYQASQTEDEETEIPSYELGGDNTVYWANVEFDPSGVL